MTIRRRAKRALKALCANFHRYGFFGDYASWPEAAARAGGYDHAAVLERVRNASLRVKKGEAAFERDSVLFDRVEYSFPVTAALLWVALRSGGKLSVMDVGGALGSHYFQNRRFLSACAGLSWNVVEQESFVAAGRREFQDENLRFYRTMSECVGQSKPQAALLSCVVQYLPDPHGFLEDLASQGLPFIIFDRTPFVEGPDRLTVQKVPPAIYDASYPAWFFNQEKFMGHFKRSYSLVAEFEGRDRVNVPCDFKGFIFERAADGGPRSL